MTEGKNKVIDNRYKIRKELGRGGISTVYLVEDTLKDNLKFALKIINKEILDKSYSKGINIIKNEFEIMTRLKHPNLVQVMDFGFADQYYITMEYLRGKLLGDIINSHILNPSRALIIIVQILRALEFIHSRNIIYRDIKPGNIMVSGNHIKLLDFGLSEFEKTKDDSVKGTFLYMAPEVLKGEINYLNDIFSLGLIFYELISGRPFYDIHNIKKIKNILDKLENSREFQLFKEDRMLPLENNPLMPIIDKMTNFHPESRYNNCSEIILEINKAVGSRYKTETRFTKESYILGNVFSDRKMEINLLKSFLYKNDNKKMIIYTGPYGVGKTRLFSEFKMYCRMNNILFFEALCEEGSSEYYSAVSNILRQILLFADIDLLEKFGPYLKLLLPLSDRLLEYKAPYIKDAKTKKDIILNNIFSFIREFVSKSSESIVFYLNDLQWIDHASLNILEKLLFTTDDNLVFYANINKNRLFPDNPLNDLLEQDLVSVLELHPFDEPGISEYFSNIFGPHFLDRSILDSINLIRDTIGGNPLFLSEIIRSLLRKNIINKDKSKWILQKKLKHIDIPGNIRDIVKERLDSVMKDAFIKTVLQTLSLIRIDLEITDIKSFIKNGFGKSLAKILQDLERTEILCSISRENKLYYRFFSTFIKDSINETIIDKAKVHQNIAYSLEMIIKKKNSSSLLEETAYHFHKGCIYDKAFYYYGKCGENAQKYYFHEKAVKYFDQALDIGKSKFEILHISLKKAESMKILAKINEAMDICKRSISLAHLKGNQIFLGRFLNLLGSIYLQKAMYKKGKACFLFSMELFQNYKDDQLYGESLKLLGNYYFYQSNFDKAISLYEHYWNICRKTNNISGITISMNNIGASYYHKGEYLKALDIYLSSIKLSKKINDHLGYCRTAGNIGNVYVKTGQYHKAGKFLHKAKNFAKKIGDRRSYGRACGNIGSYYHNQCKYARSLKYFEIDRKISQEIGDKLSEAISLMNIGSVYYFLGDYKKAMEYDLLQHNMCREIGDKHRFAKSYGNMGHNYIGLGKYKEAMISFSAEYDLFKELDDEMGIAVNYCSMGRVFFLMGNKDKAMKYFNLSILSCRDLNLDYELLKALLYKAELLIIEKNQNESLALLDETHRLSLDFNDEDYIFQSQILESRAIALESKTLAFQKLNELLKHTNAKEMKGIIYYELWTLFRKDEMKKKALKILKGVYKKTPRYEIKLRICEMESF